jgi:two-component system sensor histidine kinase YesM
MIVSYFNDLKLHTKLLLSYIFIALLPVIIIGYFLISKTIDTVYENTKHINYVSSVQRKENIINQLRSFLATADNVTNHEKLINYIQTKQNEDIDYLDSYNTFREILETSSLTLPVTDRNMTRMSVYSTNNSIIFNNSFTKSLTKEIQKTEWYADTCDAKGQSIYLEPFQMTGVPTIKDGTNYISIGKMLNPFSGTQFINVLKMDIPESEFYKLIEKESENSQIYILNDANTIVSSTNRDSIGKNVNTIPYVYDIVLNAKPDEIYSSPDHNNFVFYNNISDSSTLNNWKIISISPLDLMSNSISSIIKYSILICSISISITIVFVIFLSKTLTGRLENLTNNMSKIDEGNFEVFVSNTGNDEIAILSKSFKKMIEKVNTLINEVYLLDIEKKQAEINALQSQINPHFLFNTMESIRMNLWRKKDYETSEIIQKFAKLLRKTIEWKSDKLSLKQELELIETYLNIQKYRYKDKFTFEIRIDETLKDYIIPKFSLQPIVENAIYHGIEMKKGSGVLEIYSELDEKFLKIIVKDDGVGIESERLSYLKEQLLANTSQQNRDRIGIWNVHERLRLSYGTEYGLNVESVKNVGTTFELLLPKPEVKEISYV